MVFYMINQTIVINYHNNFQTNNYFFSNVVPTQEPSSVISEEKEKQNENMQTSLYSGKRKLEALYEKEQDSKRPLKSRKPVPHISEENKALVRFPEGDQDLFYLDQEYSEIESRDFDINGRKVNLYPTPKVKEAFKQHKVHESEKEFDARLTYLFKRSKLRLSQDSTLYLPKDFVKKNKKIEVSNDQMQRAGNDLKPASYMFVLNKKNDLLMASKKTRDKHGRIHHTSLTRGKPVKAAGLMKVIKHQDNTTSITITNESGHYKPTPISINKVLNWLEDHGFQFAVEYDKTVVKHNSSVRTVVLKA